MSRKTTEKTSAEKPAAEKPILEEAAVTVHADLSETAPSDPDSGLVGVPYLGESRREALAALGLHTQDDLRAASAEQIAAVKGIGMANAAKIKAWLDVPAAPLPVAAPEDIDMALASANQDVQDVFQKLGDAAASLREKIPAKSRDKELEKALDRQLDKIDSVASELAEGPDTLTAKQVQEAIRTLDKIAALLQSAAAEPQKLSPKKQAALIDELRARRKRLQKTLDD